MVVPRNDFHAEGAYETSQFFCPVQNHTGKGKDNCGAGDQGGEGEYVVRPSGKKRAATPLAFMGCLLAD